VFHIKEYPNGTLTVTMVILWLKSFLKVLSVTIMTFSSIAKLINKCLLFPHFSLSKQHYIQQIDIDNGFLNGILGDVYMAQSLGFEFEILLLYVNFNSPYMA